MFGFIKIQYLSLEQAIWLNLGSWGKVTWAPIVKDCIRDAQGVQTSCK